MDRYGGPLMLGPTRKTPGTPGESGGLIAFRVVVSDRA